MDAHRQRRAAFSLLLRFVFLKLHHPPGCCSPEGAGSSCWGDWSCGGWTAVTPAATTRGQRPSTAAAARASAGRSAGGRSQASCYLLFALMWETGRRRIPALCLPLPASFVAALLSPALGSRVSKSPNILVETEYSCFVMLHSAIQQQLKNILPVMSSSRVSCSNTSLCVYYMYSSSSVSASTGCSTWLGLL